MPEITASAVKELREKTGLPMMDCKKALNESQGDFEKAIEWLRVHHKQKIGVALANRTTSTGRIAVFADSSSKFGAIIDLRCETAPVASNEQFVALANDMAKQLATGPGAATPDALLDQPSPSGKGTLSEQFDDLNNRIREKFALERILRVEGPVAGYVHNGVIGTLLQFEGTPSGELARDIAQHITALNPGYLHRDEVDAAMVEKERKLLDEALALEGDKIKAEAERLLALPDEKIQDPNNLERTTSSHGRARGDLKKVEGMMKNRPKVIEGRMGQFFGERCLLEQIHPNQAKYGTKSIAELAAAVGMKIKGFVRWELPKE